MKNWETYGIASIENGILSYNGIPVFNNYDTALETFLSTGYEALEIQYPKYFKMDTLCKLAFLASEILVKNISWINDLPKESVAICTQTASSSLVTDLKFQQTIQNPEVYFPSPSVFVYTLPNVATGEICIRNGFKGENLCLVLEQFDLESVLFQIEDWFEEGQTQVCLLGWIEVSESNYCVEWSAIGKCSKESLSPNSEEKN